MQLKPSFPSGHNQQEMARGKGGELLLSRSGNTEMSNVKIFLWGGGDAQSHF